MSETEQINRWANRALENLRGGWHALAELQLLLIIGATGGFDEQAQVGGYISHAEAERIVLDMMTDPATPAP